MLVKIDDTNFVNTDHIVSVTIEPWDSSYDCDNKKYYVVMNTLNPAIVKTTGSLTWEQANQQVTNLMGYMSRGK